MRGVRPIPVSDGSWWSEKLLERSTQLRGLAQHRLRHEDSCVAEGDWRERGCNGGRRAARHAHRAAVHVVLLLRGLILVAALVRAAIMLCLNSWRLQHRTSFSGGSS